MKRGNFLGLLAASPLGFMVPKGGERNVLELTAQEFAERLSNPMKYVDDSRAMGLLQVATRPETVIEMFENNRECSKCGRATYRYRWLVESDWHYVRDNRTTPSPWYCVCGFEVGVTWDPDIHGRPLLSKDIERAQAEKNRALARGLEAQRQKVAPVLDKMRLAHRWETR